MCFLMQELEDIRKSGLKVFKDILVDESNILVWKGLIVPVRCQFQPIYLWLYNNTTTITFPGLRPQFFITCCMEKQEGAWCVISLQ